MACKFGRTQAGTCRKTRKPRRSGMSGLSGMTFGELRGDVARCIQYAQNKKGLWRCFMNAKGPGGPANRPKTIKRKYSYKSGAARARRRTKSHLVRGTKRGRMSKKATLVA